MSKSSLCFMFLENVCFSKKHSSMLFAKFGNHSNIVAVHAGRQIGSKFTMQPLATVV